MKLRNRGGIMFNLKGGNFRRLENLENEVNRCLIPFAKFSGSREGPGKSGPVKRGDILIDIEGLTILSPLTGDAEVKNDLIIIKASGSDEVSQDSIHMLEKEGPRGALERLGLLEKGRKGTLKTIIIKLTFTEPFFPKSRFLFETFKDSINGSLALIQELFPVASLKILCGDVPDKSVIRRSGNLEFLLIQEKYPFDDERLVQSVLSGIKPADVSFEKTLFLSVEKLIQIYDFIKRGVPPTFTYLAVGGNIKNPRFVKVPLFSDISELAANLLEEGGDREADYEVVINGPFRGRRSQECPCILPGESAITFLRRDTPRKLWSFMRPCFREQSYSKTFLSSLLPVERFIDNRIHGELRACVFCGVCEEVCPSRIVPFILSKSVEADELEDAKKFRIMDCIDCGLCTYACPSKISLAEIISRGKESIVKENI